MLFIPTAKVRIFFDIVSFFEKIIFVLILYCNIISADYDSVFSEPIFRRSFLRHARAETNVIHCVTFLAFCSPVYCWFNRYFAFAFCRAAKVVTIELIIKTMNNQKPAVAYILTIFHRTCHCIESTLCIQDWGVNHYIQSEIDGAFRYGAVNVNICMAGRKSQQK